MFKGSIVALVTPFNKQGAVDFEAFEKLIQWQIEEGSDGVVLCGSTGEGALLTFEEKCALFERGCKLGKGKITLIANTGTHDTNESIRLTLQAKVLGMDGALAIVPYYIRPTEEGCYRHFAELGEVGLPLIVYHHPGRTGITLSLKGWGRIAKIPQVKAVKETSGDLNILLQLYTHLDLPLLCGNDEIALPFLTAGGAGTIGPLGNLFPRQWKEFVEAALSHQLVESQEKFFSLYPLCKAMTLETNPQCVKYCLSLLGKCLPQFRLPLIEPTETTKKILKEALEAYRMKLDRELTLKL